MEMTCVQAKIQSIGLGLLFWMLLGVAMPSSAGDSTGHWVIGSWVDVHADPSSTAESVGRVTANTPVTVVSRTGDWCEIAANALIGRGYIGCEWLGTKPLDLAEIGGAPRRDGDAKAYAPLSAFWIAPSAVRFRAAGEYYEITMLSDSQAKAERPDVYREQPGVERFEWEKRKEPKRTQIPEFEAMKRFMERGFITHRENMRPLIKVADILRLAGTRGYYMGRFFDSSFFDVIQQGKLSSVKASLFKSPGDLATPTAGIEALSAQFGINERVRVVNGPFWEWVDGPRVVGSWDVGDLEITLDKPVIQYVIGRQGLATAIQLNAQELNKLSDDVTCTEGFRWTIRDEKRLEDHPGAKDPLVWFYMPNILPFKNVAVQSFARRISAHPDARRELLVMHDVDIDRDGEPDLAVWEQSIEWSRDREDFVFSRFVFVNVAGVWYFMDSDNYAECSG